MERVETTEIREIAKKLFTGPDFESAIREKPKNFTRSSFVKKVVTELKKNLREKYADRLFNDKNFIQKVRSVLGGSSSKDFIEVEFSIKSNKRPRNDPIVDYDSDVSSNDETLEQSTLDSSMLMDSMESSILNVSTRSSAGRVEELEARIFALQAENRALKSQAKASEEECRAWQDKSKDLFKVRYRPTRANGSGRCEVFDPRLDAIVLEAENQGVAAEHIREVLQALVRGLDWFDDDDKTHRKAFKIF